MKWIPVILILAICRALPAQGQVQIRMEKDAFFSENPLQNDRFSPESGNSDLNPRASAPFFQFSLPGFVQANPRGYSPLCRLELEIEEKSPVGVWMRFGDNPNVTSIAPTRAYFQLKLLDF